MDINNKDLTIEKLSQKVENQANLIKELTRENEELYHQYNHLIIRNGKLLKRIEDFQKLINEMHLRIEELQVIQGNRQNTDRSGIKGEVSGTGRSNDKVFAELGGKLSLEEFDIDDISNRWKNYPGQKAQNTPNMRKQVMMLIQLYHHPSLVSAELFSKSGVGGVTGARYVSYLKKLGVICYTGARKKGHYKITQAGIDFLENRNQAEHSSPVNSEKNLRARIYLENAKSEDEIEVDQNDL